MTQCKNCGSEFDGNFCNFCGQSAATHRLNFKFLWHDIQHGLFHLDKGIFFSLKQLFINPGAMIRNYIAGRRIGHFKPFSMLVVLATIYGLLKHFFITTSPADSKLVVNNFTINPETINAISDWINQHDAMMALLIIPFYALASYLVYKKQGYNYVEHLVLNAYASSFRLLISILMFPFEVLTLHKTGSDVVNLVTTFFEFAFTLWCFIQFFDQLRWVQTVKKLMLSYVIFVAEMLVIAVFFIGFVLLYFHAAK